MMEVFEYMVLGVHIYVIKSIYLPMSYGVYTIINAFDLE